VISPVPGAFSRHVGIEFIDDTLHVRQKGIIFRGGLQNGLLNAPEYQDGITIASLPQVTVKPAEQVDFRVVPTPPQIVGKPQQRLQSGRK
jgi:hypothetical protein